MPAFTNVTDERSASDIFNEQRRLDRDQVLSVASIIRGDPGYNRPADYWINIFNISPVEFVRHRPPDFPTVIIKGCPAGEPWILAVKVPNEIHFKIVSPDTGQVSFANIRGERWATDLLDPSNLGENIWLPITNKELQQMHGSGDDLTKRGVFWSRNDVPTAEELGKATAKMTQHYRQLVQAADNLARVGKMAEIEAEAHVAADFLRLSNTWHIVTDVPTSCPNCGEPIKAGAAYHASSLGGICVIDWQKTVASGVRLRSDVPEEARWWKELEPPRPEKRA